MNEIVVISGKGGTGKTSITSSFAALESQNMVIADCDVDAADMHLITKPEILDQEDFYSGKVAKIDSDNCVQCNQCINVCHFDAISIINNRYVVDPIACEGCNYCYKICPVQTISMKNRLAGEFYISKTRFNNILVHAKLGIAADNSGKLVTKVREEAKDIADEERVDYLLIDASPGIGCPVVAALTGADFVVIVTEPSYSGLHDLSRVLELTKKLKLKTACILNKADINIEIAGKVKEFLNRESIPILAELPYDKKFTEAISMGKTIVEFDNGIIREKIENAWKEIKNKVT